MAFELFIFAAALIAGSIAAITGFAIGSLLTPAIAFETGTKLAVAVIAIPHFLGTLYRFVILREHIDRRVLLGFGTASAAGGLVGALLNIRVSSRALTFVFGALLLMAGISELTGWISRVHWGRRAAWISGALSGVFGGLVGNQGGIRSAALLGFDVPKVSFVATSTAIALIVDVVRLPVYLATHGRDIAMHWPLVLVASAGVLIGTPFGARVLGRVPDRLFRRIVALLLVSLGLYMIIAGGE